MPFNQSLKSNWKITIKKLFTFLSLSTHLNGQRWFNWNYFEKWTFLSSFFPFAYWIALHLANKFNENTEKKKKKHAKGSGFLKEEFKRVGKNSMQTFSMLRGKPSRHPLFLFWLIWFNMQNPCVFLFSVSLSRVMAFGLWSSCLSDVFFLFYHHNEMVFGIFRCECVILCTFSLLIVGIIIIAVAADVFLSRPMWRVHATCAFTTNKLWVTNRYIYILNGQKVSKKENIEYGFDWIVCDEVIHFMPCMERRRRRRRRYPEFRYRLWNWKMRQIKGNSVLLPFFFLIPSFFFSLTRKCSLWIRCGNACRIVLEINGWTHTKRWLDGKIELFFMFFFSTFFHFCEKRAFWVHIYFGCIVGI